MEKTLCWAGWAPTVLASCESQRSRQHQKATVNDDMSDVSVLSLELHCDGLSKVSERPAEDDKKYRHELHRTTMVNYSIQSKLRGKKLMDDHHPRLEGQMKQLRVEARRTAASKDTLQELVVEVRPPAADTELRDEVALHKQLQKMISGSQGLC